MCIRDRYQRRVRGFLAVHMELQWTSGLCSCFDDCGSCFYALCCPCCANASARTAFDNSNFCFNCLCVSPCVVRNLVREAYNIEGTCCGDLLCPCFCNCCAISQVIREVKARGSATAVNMVTNTGHVVRMESPDGANQWSSGLCSCFDDCGSCCYACFCPSCAVASAGSRYDGSNCCFNCLVKNPCVTHSIIREGKYNIDGTCLQDICLPFCCYTCSAARMLREVKTRGPVSGGTTVMVQQVQSTTMVQPYRQA
eukprot:TRINITY_DN38102_c0_g1_i1.p1 TRINITY_DN38102_c0_g1~~TRINITY_DN38102_c0_g1_i1.p1  ORF type:complete len:254 (-),score=22.49 TRINITY_DN38102_c0_g1_i1:266-1027(-)